jgi:hypothetical protein
MLEQFVLQTSIVFGLSARVMFKLYENLVLKRDSLSLWRGH